MGQTREYRLRAIVDRPANNKELLALGKRVSQKTHATINPLPPALADLDGALPNFETAIETAANQKGTAAALAQARQAVVEALEHLADQITAIARKQPVDAGKTTIEGTGLHVKKVAIRSKPPLAAKYASVSGWVILVARAAAKSATYFWSFSTDGKNWVDCPSTLKAITTFGGLTPSTLYYFRFRSQTRKGMGDWSPSISLIAH